MQCIYLIVCMLRKISNYYNYYNNYNNYNKICTRIQPHTKNCTQK